jgi:hypothetical protein
MPPARPSPGEVGDYERLLQSGGWIECPDWVLLGCTPEIRSLAARHRREILCIDQNPEVFDVLRSMVAPQYAEQFLCSDWLHAEIPAPVDIVLGDGSLNMVPRSQHESFLFKVSQMLRPGGAALLRVHVMGPPRFGTPEQVFEWYRANASTEPVFSATRTDLDMLWLDRATGRLSFPDFHRKIRRLHRLGIITPEEFEAYDRLMGFNRINLYYVTREGFERAASAYFDVSEVCVAEDYTGSGNHPLYLLRKGSVRG